MFASSVASRTRIGPAVLMLAGTLTLGACSGGGGRTLEPPTATDGTASQVLSSPGALTVSAPWTNGLPIPVEHTCDGADQPPTLAWSGVPADAAELAVAVTDLDATGYVHWLVTGLDPNTASLDPAGLPDRAIRWPNSAGSSGYAGPCPPPGAEHRYVYTVYALSPALALPDGSTIADVLAALPLAAIEQSSVYGTFGR